MNPLHYLGRSASRKSAVSPQCREVVRAGTLADPPLAPAPAALAQKRLTAARAAIFALLLGALALGAASPAAAAAKADPSDNHGHGSLDNVGIKLANPVSDVWALFTEIDLGFNNGAANGGEDFVFFQTLFQPVMPIKLTQCITTATGLGLPRSSLMRLTRCDRGRHIHSQRQDTARGERAPLDN